MEIFEQIWNSQQAVGQTTEPKPAAPASDVPGRFPLQNEAMDFLKDTYRPEADDRTSETVKDSPFLVNERVIMNKVSKI